MADLESYIVRRDGDTNPPLSERVARDPYVRHVVGHLIQETSLDHAPNINWHAEMSRHAIDKYGPAVTVRVMYDALLQCSDEVAEDLGIIGSPHGQA